MEKQVIGEGEHNLYFASDVLAFICIGIGVVLYQANYNPT